MTSKTSPKDQIEMVHTKLPDAQPVATTRLQLEQVWQPLGWTEFKDGAAARRKTTATPADTATTKES